MKIISKNHQRSTCPINLMLEALGDGWSLLIVRDLMLMGRKTFNEFLNAEEKIASNILTDRLKRLETNGIVTKQRDVKDGRRIVYKLTDKGIDLLPTIIEIMLWASKYEQTNIPQEMLNNIHENREKFIEKIKGDWDNQ